MNKINFERPIVYQVIKFYLGVVLFFLLSMLDSDEACAQEGANYKVIGKMNAVEGSMVKLTYTDSGGKLIQDSTRVKGGKFRFNGSINGTFNAVIQYPKPDASVGYSELYLESGKIQVKPSPEEGDDLLPVSGTKTNNEYQVFLKEIEKVNTGIKPLNSEYDSLNDQYIKEKKEGKSEEELQPIVNKLEDLRKKFEPFQTKIKGAVFNFFTNYPQSYVTADRLKFYTGRLSLDSLSMFYGRLGTQLQQSIAGKHLADEIKKIKAGSPGSTAFVFNAKDIEGKPLSLSDFRGRYVLLDFWASWCIPCRKGNPHLKTLYNKYKNLGFEIVGISDDDSKPDLWRAAVEKDGIAVWKHVLRGLKLLPNNDYDRTNDINNSYGVHNLPTKILIDREGKIIGRYDSAEEALDEKLVEIFDTI